jgi:hypothetical protein
MSIQLTGLEEWRTEQVLAVYERVFGALERRTRRRIIETARAQGWDGEALPDSHEEALALAA